MKSICIITKGYPYKADPTYAFVQQLVDAWARAGIKCFVISPQSVTKSLIRKKNIRPTFWNYEIDNNVIEVYQPKYVSLSRTKSIILGEIVFQEYCAAVEHVFNRFIKGKVDCVYGHFWYSGICAGRLASKNGIQAFVASGESVIDIEDFISIERHKKEAEQINGVICVSGKNKVESVQLGLTSEEKCCVIPNAVNTKIFKRIDKKEARKLLGFDNDVFIVSFVGHFDERKGVLRVAEALNKIEDVKFIFVGKGSLTPNCNGILFSGQVEHDYLPNYLCASDVFVLPTLAEGCCNAIVEALACGLPVISSNLSFNDEILSNEYSIRIDPTNIEEISNAISYLKQNREVLESMALNAFNMGSKLDIDSRAKTIIEFMENPTE